MSQPNLIRNKYGTHHVVNGTPWHIPDLATFDAMFGAHSWGIVRDVSDDIVPARRYPSVLQREWSGPLIF